MKSPKDRISRLANRNSELERKIHVLERKLKDTDDKNKKLVCKNSQLKKKIAELETEVGGHCGTEAVIKDMMKPENRAGVGPYLGRVNHIALIVSDVGRSAKFYSEILGLPQINRPNFDRHGAWFTCGNVELHLIKGEPIVHDGTNLIVAHIAIESDEIAKVQQKLIDLGVPYEQNVSVPSTQVQDGGLEQKSRVVSEDTEKMAMGAVTQYFFRDPDGYYFELCNCEVLTEFCFAKNPFQMNYVEGVLNPLKVLARGAQTLQDWRSRFAGTETSMDDVFDMFDPNRSGEISTRDLFHQLKAFGQTELKNLEGTGEENKMISRGEFENIMSDKSNLENELRAVFKLMDLDNSGFLTAAELRHVMTQYNLHLNDSEIDGMIAKLDRDGDGQVDIEEFLDAFANSPRIKKTLSTTSITKADSEIFENLKRRRGVYGDIMQSVMDDDELKQLLIKFRNCAPAVINYLGEKHKSKRILLPPAYLKADGTRFEPEAIQLMYALSQSLPEEEDNKTDEQLSIDSPKGSSASVNLATIQ